MDEWILEVICPLDEWFKILNITPGHNIVCSQISHKHIHIMGWKDQTSKEIATCGKFVSP